MMMSVVFDIIIITSEIWNLCGIGMANNSENKFPRNNSENKSFAKNSKNKFLTNKSENNLRMIMKVNLS